MLVSMAKVQVIGPKRYFYDVIGTLHQLGILHIEDISKKLVGDGNLRRMSMDEKTMQLKSNLENLLIRVNGIVTAILPPQEPEGADQVKNMYYHEYWRNDTEELKNVVNSLIAELEGKTRELAKSKSSLEMELSSLERYQAIAQKIEPLAKQMVALEGFETVAFLVEKKFKSILDVINSEMSKLTKDQFEIVSADVDENTTAALAIFNKRYSAQVHQFLSGNVTEVRLPPELAHEPFDVALSKISERKDNLPKDLTKAKDELSELSKDWYLKLSAVSEVLKDRAEEIGVVPQFGETDFTFVITGWLPVKDTKKTEQRIHDQFGERVIFTQLPVTQHELEEAPVVLENPAWAKPFEVVLKILQPPRYGTIDPTPFLAFFIPAFFGLILGDVGYGLLIFLGGMWARKKYKARLVIEAIGSMFMAMGISCIIFGFIYGEMFGDLPKRLGLLQHTKIGGFPIPFERVDNMMVLLYICIGLGFSHIMLGLSLGVINALREKAFKHAYEKAGLLLFFGALVFYGIIIYILKVPATIGQGITAVLMAAGLALIIYGAGVLGIFEIFGLMGNIFSYARIMALGLAGVILGEVANELGASMGILVGGLIALLLHTINLAVGAFSPTIHSIRLNLLEFFGKFYEAGGKEYKPFKARR